MSPFLSSPRPRGRVVRLLAGLLTAAHLALALGAGVHVGDHDESGLEWLPRQFHQHDFQMVAAADEGAGPEAAICVACHMGRLGLRLLPATAAPAVALQLTRWVRADDLGPRATHRSPRTSRGPPLA